MVDPPGSSPASDEIRVDGEGSATGMPRWVKVSLLVTAGLVLVFVVLQFAGMGGGHGPGRHFGGADGAGTVAEDAVRFAVTGEDLRFDPDEITVPAGTDVAIVLTSADVLHDFVIDELDAHVAAEKGETATGGFPADRPGRYTYYCAEPGHREGGMEGTLIVAEAAPSGGEGGHRPPAGGHG